MIILPLFLRTPDFAALAPRRERVTQWTVAVGTTLVIFSSSDVPPQGRPAVPSALGAVGSLCYWKRH